jgi:hypothetical protein
MIQLSLTPDQLKILKEALDYHLDGFLKEDAPSDWDNTADLRDFINYKLTLEKINNDQQ